MGSADWFSVGRVTDPALSGDEERPVRSPGLQQEGRASLPAFLHSRVIPLPLLEGRV